MKRVLLSVFMLVSAIVFAQKDVTKFLGIPVDGTKAEMMKKLKAKGFTYKNVAGMEFMEGEFNGHQVNVHVVTNNNKVYRIMVSDVKGVDEASIKIRFNNLVSQFENNKRYTTFESYTIPDDERISYKMVVEKKRYQAAYYQNPDIDDSLAFREVNEKLLTKYTKEQIYNPTDEIKKDIQHEIFKVGYDRLFKKSVWFMISERFGEYYITMYYDNEDNRANGEDL